MTPLERFRYIRTLRMPPVAKLTLCILTSHAEKAGKLWISQRLLAAEVGVTDRAIRTALALLKSSGLLIERPSAGHSSDFLLTLEAFQTAATPELRSYPPRNYVPTEVAPLKVRKRSLPHTTAPALPDPRPICRSCKARLGDGESCIPCHKYRESLRGLHNVLPNG